MRAWILTIFCSCGAVAQTSRDSLALATLERETKNPAEITRLTINSVESDYSPILLNDQLYFVSGRPSRMAVLYADDQNKTAITDIYVARYKPGDRFGDPEPLKMNTRKYEGPFCFNRGGDTLYYSGNSSSGMLCIFYTVKKNSRWTRPSKLGFCTDSFAYCHPSLSPDGRLYLSSNQGTGGNMDLFYTQLSQGNWSRPVNLGKAVNTPGNEVFPYAQRKDHLYFSSDRAGGMGGLDLYEIPLQSDASPLPLPPPVNSTADDFGIWTDSSGNTGFISSSRNGSRSDDLYRFKRSFPDFSRCQEPPVRTRFCYSFFEARTALKGDTAGRDYRWHFGDGASAQGVRTRHCYQQPGNYTVQLRVTDKISGSPEITMVSYEIFIPEQEKLGIAAPDTTRVNSLVVLDASASAVKDHDITGFYWSFGDGCYNTGPMVGHRFNNAGLFQVEIRVTARNRNDGSTRYFKSARPLWVIPEGG